MLVGITIAVFFAAFQYENNLSYLVLALMVSATTVSVVHTYRNLADIEVDAIPMPPVFVEDAALLKLDVYNHKGIAAYSLMFDLPGSRVLDKPMRLDHISPANNHILELKLDATHRGKHRITSLRVSSSFPFSLFRASFSQPIATEYFVYPKPESLRPWLESVEESTHGHQMAKTSGDDFYGWKSYHPGDSLHHVNWKAFARGHPLLVQEYAGNHTPLLWFDWEGLNEFEAETKLSQIAFWVIEAHQQGIPYGLRLPNSLVPPGTGNNHFHQCLRALALYS